MRPTKGGIALVGYPGAGKTVVARALAEKIEFRLIDLDSTIEKRQQRKVPEIIRVEGEAKFRELEKEVLRDLVNESNVVLSVGGGALLDPHNRELIRTSMSLCVELVANKSTLLKRVVEDEQASGDNPSRPLLRSKGESVSQETIRRRLEDLLDRREKLNLFSELQAVRVITDFAGAETIAQEIADWINLGFSQHERMTIVPVELPGATTSIVTGEASLPEVVKHALGSAEKKRTAKVAVFVDQAFWRCWRKEIEPTLNQFGDKIIVEEIRSGETSKSLDLLSNLADKLLESEVSRADSIVAVGGGVVGDLIGFLSSVYLRGVDYYQVPTTVVAMVDSAIGGKTAVNRPSAKNCLGTFALPVKTFSNPVWLKTLPEREYISGLAEVVKYGLIGSREFFSFLEQSADLLLLRNEETLRSVIERCSIMKTEFVASDLEDKLGIRACLNLGHTLGHAIESLAGYGELLHGEAVSIGMAFAAAFGEELRVTSEEVFPRMQSLLNALRLPTEMPACLIGKNAPEVADWKRALMSDKKRQRDEISFILLREIGIAQVHQVEVTTLLKFLSKQMLGGKW